MPTVENTPDDLLDNLAYARLKSVPLLRSLARKPKHLPSNDECHEIARRQVEHLKRSGVEKIIRRESGVYSWPPRDKI